MNFDTAIDALHDVQRRRLLLELLDHNPVDDSRTFEADEDTSVEEARIQLQHVHLPKLAEYGLIRWEQEGGQVVKGEEFDQIKPLLTLLNEHEEQFPFDLI